MRERSYRFSAFSGHQRFDITCAEFGHPCVDFGCAREDMAGLEEVFRAIQARDDATGLPDNQAARRQVPGREAGFPERVEPPRCDVGKVKRRSYNRTVAARSRGLANTYFSSKTSEVSIGAARSYKMCTSEPSR